MSDEVSESVMGQNKVQLSLHFLCCRPGSRQSAAGVPGAARGQVECSLMELYSVLSFILWLYFTAAM